MANDRKTTKNATNSSKLQRANLSDEELLEEILNKKKTKKKTSVKKEIIDDVQNELNEDEKKITRKKSTATKKSVTKSKSELTDDELLASIISKKAEKKVGRKSTQKKVDNLGVDSENTVVVNGTEIEKASLGENEEKADKISPKKDDLIITREINFDDVKLDLKNKKVLRELRKAIEDFDNLEDLEEIHNSLDLINDDNLEEKDSSVDSIVVKNSDDYDDDYLVSAITSNGKKSVIKYEDGGKQKFILILICVILIAILIYIFYNFAFKIVYSSNDNSSKSFKGTNQVETLEEELEELNLKKQKYEECLNNKEVTVSDINEKYMNAKSELDSYLQENYKAAVAYLDLDIGFEFTHDYHYAPGWYAASTTKTLAALYIYTKAFNNEIDLNTTMVYSSKYSYTESKGMKTHKYGDKVTLRDLVKYAIIYSDNSAYQMLFDYIGMNNLKEYGCSIGACSIFFGGDHFGHIYLSDGLAYMLALNNYINNSGELGEELKSYFVNAEQNDVAILEEGIEAAHKYGQYAQYYHDIGIVYDEHPYIVVILTLEGKSNFEEKVKDIARHVYDMHKTFYENREEVCRLEVYGN